MRGNPRDRSISGNQTGESTFMPASAGAGAMDGGSRPGTSGGPGTSSGMGSSIANDLRESDFEYTSLEPERIPGAGDMAKMEFVPRGMEHHTEYAPTKKDMEPLREVAVSPMDYLRTPEERANYLDRRRFTIRMLPFTNTNIFILQIAAIMALYITIAMNFSINDPESSLFGEIGGLDEFLLWDSAVGASFIAISFGTAVGGFGAWMKGLSMRTKTQWSMFLMQAIAGAIAFITVFFIFVPFFDIKWLNHGNLEFFMNYVIIPSIYFSLLILFSAAVILGVYGLLTGSTGPISLSTAMIFLQIAASVNSFQIQSDDLYFLFFDEWRIVLFSMAYLAYVELSFAVSKFAIDWKRTTRYDHRTGEQTFTNLLGSTINLYITFFIGIIIATFIMALFSTNLDWIFSQFTTPAIEDSISHSTIYGKTLFALIFFGILGFVKGIIPVKEYIEGRMNVTGEEIDIPMTIVEESDRDPAVMFNGNYRGR
jgi:hypothetical protein